MKTEPKGRERVITRGWEKEKEASEEESENEWDTLSDQGKGDWRTEGRNEAQFSCVLFLMQLIPMW